MQPARAGRRPIRQTLRRGEPLLYERLSDAILVKRAKDGDQRALEALCKRHQPKVVKLARRVLRDPDDASDAAQESLAKMCARIRQFRGESQFATWLHRLTLNTCHDVYARKRPWEPLPEEAGASTDPEPVDVSSLRRCLLELPPEQARILVLKDVLEFSFAEIAAAGGMPVGTAKCYAHRGRKRLRERLEAREAAA